MHCKKHKRKMNHVVIVTSDAVDANVKQFRIKPGVMQVIILVLCIIIGVLIGYFNYERTIWEAVGQRTREQQTVITSLEEENSSLQTEIASLNDQIQILSDTVNQKAQSESELAAQLEEQSMPTEFPLNGAASIQEVTEGNPMCIFTASAGTMVVATASGTVTAVNDDAEYGHSVWIDHGNGYVSIYRNQGDTVVKQGDQVAQGTSLFIIGEDNTTLGYQLTQDGTYINPMDMLAISG